MHKTIMTAYLDTPARHDIHSEKHDSMWRRRVTKKKILAKGARSPDYTSGGNDIELGKLYKQFSIKMVNTT